MELSLPNPQDLDEVLSLVHDCFDRVYAQKRLRQDDWGPLGGVAGAWNAFKRKDELKEIEQGLRFRLDLALQFPSLKRPVKQDSTIGVLAREMLPGRPGRGPLCAYFELCLLPSDGRRFEDLGEGPSSGDGELAPYFSNLCVDPELRRLGLGRAMLQLAEVIVAKVWGDDQVYLHIDDYEPSRRLYTSAGYEIIGVPETDGVTHMRRMVRLESDASKAAEGDLSPELGAKDDEKQPDGTASSMAEEDQEEEQVDEEGVDTTQDLARDLGLEEA